jgi:hypothetical protein
MKHVIEMDAMNLAKIDLLAGTNALVCVVNAVQRFVEYAMVSMSIH